MKRSRTSWMLGLLLLTLVGCAGASPVTETARLPPRPGELPLDRVDPCALLTSAQVRQLGVGRGERGDNGDGLGSIDCLWRNFPEQPDVSYLARLVVKRGADYALDSATGAQVVTIDGFPTVQTSSPYADPKQHCLLLVDVAKGQSLWVQWDTHSSNYPGLTHDLACQQAQEGGRLMLANLRDLSR